MYMRIEALAHSNEHLIAIAYEQGWLPLKTRSLSENKGPGVEDKNGSKSISSGPLLS
jgi:hypothetical protein